jgi:propanediol utilization protein
VGGCNDRQLWSRTREIAIGVRANERDRIVEREQFEQLSGSSRRLSTGRVLPVVDHPSQIGSRSLREVDELEADEKAVLLGCVRRRCCVTYDRVDDRPVILQGDVRDSHGLQARRYFDQRAPQREVADDDLLDSTKRRPELARTAESKVFPTVA